MRSKLMLAGLLTVAGCASRPVTFAETTPVPSARVHWQDSAPPSATLIVVRDRAALKPNIAHEIVLDGQLAATIMEREKLYLAVPPGEHTIGSRTTNPLIGRSLKTTTVSAETGKVYYFRDGVLENGVPTFNRTFGPDE